MTKTDDYAAAIITALQFALSAADRHADAYGRVDHDDFKDAIELEIIRLRALRAKVAA